MVIGVEKGREAQPAASEVGVVTRLLLHPWQARGLAEWGRLPSEVVGILTREQLYLVDPVRRMGIQEMQVASGGEELRRLLS
jgi:hypothetical protein